MVKSAVLGNFLDISDQKGTYLERRTDIMYACISY